MLIMRLRLIRDLSIFASMAVCQQPAEETPVFRGGVAFVRLDVQVSDGKRLIAGLAKEDFEVFDEGAPQKIEYFGRESEPLWALLLLDVSGSMKPRVQEMGQAAREALRVLGPDDRMAVMLFGSKTKLTQDFTASFGDASGAILAASRESSLTAGSSINPAILDAAKLIKEKSANQPGRRTVILLTDNEGLNYKASDEETIAALQSADAVLNGILTPKAKPPKPWGNGNPDFCPNDVFKLAKATGGETLQADKTGPVFREMMERIRTRYSLHYRAPEAAPRTVRRIRVELAAAARKRYPKAEVRTRSGYTAP